MSYNQRYDIKKIKEQNDEFALVIYLDDYMTEFANELGTVPEKRQNLMKSARSIIKKHYPKLRVTMVRVVMGGIVVAAIPLTTNAEAAAAETFSPAENTGQVAQMDTIYYQVSSGDTLWNVSKKFNTTVENLKRANNLTSDVLQINQKLVIPQAFHTVKTGDYLSILARDYGTTVEAIRKANNLPSDVVRLGQTLIIPKMISSTEAPTNLPVPEQPTNTGTSYTVVAGDSLSVIAKRFGTTTDAIRSINHLSSDVIRIGQVLTIPVSPANENTTPEAPPITAANTYTVVAGDSLSAIAKRFGTTTDTLRNANNLTTDVLLVGQTLKIPDGGNNETSVTSHTVRTGENLWVIASQYATTVDAIKNVNNLKTDILQPGQVLTIPAAGVAIKTPVPEEKVQEERKTFTYRVVSGDSLSVIANRFGVSVDAIRTSNNLKTDTLQIGQALTIPEGLNAPPQASLNTITYTTHTVVSGDNIWDLSVRYGIPQSELLRANNLTATSTLSIGQKLQIPVYKIGVKQTVSANHGELLDWRTEAQYVFTIGKTAKVTDLTTGKSFNIKRTIGANHADSETVSVNDTNIAKSIWGGFSWSPRAVILEVDGRKLAASMSFMPHERDYIANNGINGHFDVYFSNSTRHVDGLPDKSHQAMVEKAAGVR